MIGFARPYSFRHVLGQGVTQVSAPVGGAPTPAPAPKAASSGTVNIGGYEVSLLTLAVATAAVVGALWVTAESIQAIDRG